MDDKAQQRTIVIRGVLTVACIAGGFVFPLLFLLAVFFAWTIYSDLTDRKPTVDAWYTRRWTATPDDPDWKTYFMPFCESPAEEAFLEAMITDYKLLPNAGVLVGSGLELNLQVEHKPYRVDFLANKWLVVEIDGAAYHSSPEAVERDRIRDEFFVANGFSVVRIPAKVVFNTPKRAVEMVRAAVARGAPTLEVVATPPPVSVTQTFLNAVKSVDEFIADVDAHVKKARAIEKALASSKQTFSTEKLVIDSAMETAKRALDLEAELAANPNLQKYIDAANAELEQLMKSTKENGAERDSTITILPISMPPMHPDSNINAAILLAYLNLTAERSRYFSEVHTRIARDPGLLPHVQSHLEQLGCHSTWRELQRDGSAPKSGGNSISGGGSGSSAS